jgi:hypothetical protein
VYRCGVPFSSRFKRLIPRVRRDDQLGFQKMKFLARDEASLLDKKFRREIAEYAGPKFALYYESGGRDYSGAANAVAQSAGSFSEATVLFSFCVSGDGWDEHSATDERWKRYRRWRAANNEERRLYEAPGHRFELQDVEQFSKTIEFALELGWDALVAAKPGRQLLFLSHDDRLEIYRGFSSGLLVRQLTGLGYWRRADR